MENEKKLTATDKAVIALCALGASFMSYLAYLHFKTTPGTLCDFGAGFSCEIVNKSVYSTLLGVPLSLLGLTYFVGVAALVWKKFLPDGYHFIQAFTISSLIFSADLSFIEFHELGAICVFCEASKLVMIAILGITALSAHRDSRRIPAHVVAVAVAAGVAFVGVARYLQGA
jgi:uncharacterized membrane protein